MKKLEQGFTLIEILLGLLLSVSVFLVANSLMVSLFFRDVKSKGSETLEQTMNDLSVDLTNNIKWAGEISFSGSQLMADDNIYELRDGRIYKNSEALTAENVAIEKFEIKNYSGAEEISSLKITIEMQHKVVSSVRDVLNLIVSQRLTESVGGQSG